MTAANDALIDAETRDRLYYAMGVLLDATDFDAEQAYHRGRLARALSYLHGMGTAAGHRQASGNVERGPDPARVDSRPQDCVVGFVLVRVAVGELDHRTVEMIAAAEVGGDRDAVPGAGVGVGEHAAAEARVNGERTRRHPIQPR